MVFPFFIFVLFKISKNYNKTESYVYFFQEKKKCLKTANVCFVWFYAENLTAIAINNNTRKPKNTQKKRRKITTKATNVRMHHGTIRVCSIAPSD